MIVRCPNCNHGIEIKPRAEMGKGTQSAKKSKRLNENKIALLRLFAEKKISKPSTVRDIQSLIFNSSIPRKLKNGTKSWNYHDVQADLSFLVGCGILSMSKDVESSMDRETADWEVNKRPRYWLEEGKLEGVNRVLAHRGHLIYMQKDN